MEMERIKGDEISWREELVNGLKKFGDALIIRGKARKSSHKFFSNAVSFLDTIRNENERPDAKVISAFLTIPGLLQEQVEQIIVTKAATTESPVYIRMNEDSPLDATEFTLQADGEEIAFTENFITAVALWIAAFYVFNLNYPPGVSKTLQFLQRVILNVSDELPPPRSIITLTNKLLCTSK